MSKLLLKEKSNYYKHKISKAFGCTIFEPGLCCFCREVEIFVNQLVKKEHDPEFCASDW